jgi:cytochrome c
LKSERPVHAKESIVNTRLTIPRKVIATIALVVPLAAPSANAADAAAAETLARQNGCLKCHAIDKQKEAPSYKEIAAKYKGKPEAEDKLITHITSAAKVKFPDGHEEEHKVIKTKDPKELKNLVGWILSL